MIKQLSRGSKGPMLAVVQKALNARIKAGLDPDCRFWVPPTQQAIVAFQKRYYLQVDGIVGSQTRHALFPLVGLTLHAAGGFIRGRLPPDGPPDCRDAIGLQTGLSWRWRGAQSSPTMCHPADPNLIAEQLLKLLPLLKRILLQAHLDGVPHCPPSRSGCLSRRS